MSSQNKIFLSPPHMTGKEFSYIKQAFDTNWIAPLGENVDKFEHQIASFVGSKGAVALSSGTAAIHLALAVLGIKKDDKVFCSTLTFIASANPILYQQAIPVFIDSEPETWNMCPEMLLKAFKVAEKEGELPKAVIVVNLYGQSAKMDEILAICNHYGVPVIEDAAESLGSSYKGKASGTFGKLGVYSFNGNKIITTSSGGMLVSDDKELINKAQFLATQAKDKASHYQHSTLGFNYRMSNILAGVGRAQMEVLKERVFLKRSVFKKYFNELSTLPGLEFMPELEGTVSNRWLTTMIINRNKSLVSSREIIQKLVENNIEARPVWKPLHLQPLFKGRKVYLRDDRFSENVFENGVCLPSGINMDSSEQDRVINLIKKSMSVVMS
ncbi:aminotransferase class I/II-fold pyridoxal phosphate-dependent enzyme [Bacillus carboniphilus]|uniref:Aminotransferase class I/II-fold pyridoxal phosphate-dependent enzyme n=1 Tax=Bacillus carboniphilus TaxID=86663 RepID=A0ABY9JTQ5_9BACI|nr:aminotransferase class I/II-fold pyridoxal phosphate-dependent enzyme [Bacillus carboniphilus]WLR42786.1 aminotransferase class I/II-fold pyridoxal phosphate-dependent enzyme [Bacillus carboniphilus]